jgi:hypothetical protein
MFERSELRDLQTRKELLLQTIQIHRCLLRLEAERCREVTLWVDTGITAAGTAATILSAFSRLVTPWHSRSGPSSGFLSKLAAGITLALSATKMWNTWKQGSRTAEAPGK